MLQAWCFTSAHHTALPPPFSCLAQRQLRACAHGSLAAEAAGCAHGSLVPSGGAGQLPRSTGQGHSSLVRGRGHRGQLPMISCELRQCFPLTIPFHVSIYSCPASKKIPQDLSPDFLLPFQCRFSSFITEHRTEFSVDRSLGHCFCRSPIGQENQETEFEK